MPIKLRQLEIFVAVAETARVTRASKRLSITQPAVSMALADLENQIGAPLFNRYHKAMLLNDRGRRLLSLSREMLYLAANIEKNISTHNTALKGTINVVASTTIGNYVLPYFVCEFRRMHPQVRINIQVLRTHYAEDLVLKGKMDVGFVEGAVCKRKIVAREWLEDEMVVVTSPMDPLSQKRVFNVETDFKNTYWVMGEKGSGSTTFFNEKMKDYLDRIMIVMEMGHPEAVKKAVELGVGLACLSSFTVCQEVERGSFVTLSVAGVDMRRKFHIISREKMKMHPVMKEFLKFCDAMSTCTHLHGYLSSPVKLQAQLANRLKEHIKK